MSRFYPKLCSLIVVSCLSACSGPRIVGTLEARSLGREPVVLRGKYQFACFSHDERLGATSFMLADAPIEQVLGGQIVSGQILHVELLWRPKPGATPVESTATNATVRHVIFSNGEVGIYGGAGF